jgi:uncharacterized protein with HEPN domain
MPFSFDKEIVIDIFKNILWSIDQIEKRFAQIKTSDDFLKDDEGLEKLDSICMQLINIGEALKQIDKITDSKLLENYGGIDWKRAKGMRDIITHHYFDIDAEIVYSVCSAHLPEMEMIVSRILKDLEEER